MDPYRGTERMDMPDLNVLLGSSGQLQRTVHAMGVGSDAPLELIALVEPYEADVSRSLEG